MCQISEHLTFHQKRVFALEKACAPHLTSPLLLKSTGKLSNPGIDRPAAKTSRISRHLQKRKTIEQTWWCTSNNWTSHGEILLFFTCHCFVKSCKLSSPHDFIHCYVRRYPWMRIKNLECLLSILFFIFLFWIIVFWSFFLWYYLVLSFTNKFYFSLYMFNIGSSIISTDILFSSTTPFWNKIT